MNVERKPIEIEVQGQWVQFKSDGDPEQVQAVVKIVSDRIREAEEKSRSAKPHQIAVLALLDLAEDYLQAKVKVAEHHSQMTQKSDEILKRLKKIEGSS